MPSPRLPPPRPVWKRPFPPPSPASRPRRASTRRCARGEADANSDLDLHALVSGNQRWRSSFVEGGVPVEVFHNPPGKVRAMFAEPDHATVAMFAGGRVVLPHPDLDALIAEARALHAAGPLSRVLTPAERHLLVDEVVEARSLVGDPLHVYVAMGAAGRLVRALYAARGWWEVKPRAWLRDLDQRGAPEAGLLRLILSASAAAERQAALEALALAVLPGGLAYGESATEPQTVP